MDSEKIASAVAQLREIADELETPVEESEQPAGPYQGAYDFRFTRTYGGILTEDDLEEMHAEWIQIVESLQPVTRQSFRNGGGRGMFVSAQAGGLEVRSGGKAHRAFRLLRRRWYDLAAAKALAERKAAGWEGPRYLTTPDGRQKGANGQYFGPFTRPSILDRLNMED